MTAAEQQRTARTEEFRIRRDAMSARCSAAEAQVQINEAFAGVSDELADLGSVLEGANSDPRIWRPGPPLSID